MALPLPGASCRGRCPLRSPRAPLGLSSSQDQGSEEGRTPVGAGLGKALLQVKAVAGVVDARALAPSRHVTPCDLSLSRLPGSSRDGACPATQGAQKRLHAALPKLTCHCPCPVPGAYSRGSLPRASMLKNEQKRCLGTSWVGQA